MINPKVFVAGHKGMVGSALVRSLKNKDVKVITRDKAQLNLLNQTEVKSFFHQKKIDQVYLAAAKVGGICANNNFPAEFIYENLMIQTNIIHNAFLAGVKKLLILGSSCIYPKNINRPIKEQDLLTGKLEPTNEPYAIAKISGIKLCESYNRQYGKSHSIDYRCVMPTNLYGPGDNYHPENSHVIPALINRFHTAKINNLSSTSVWGTGTPRREFMYVDDLANACIHIMNLDKKIYEKLTSPTCSHINVGSGKDLTINEIANIISDIIGYNGKIIFDVSKPDGVNRKLIDSTIINSTGFKCKVTLKEGLRKTYQDYKKNINKI
jgi:GDP-L-fucose synthase